MSTHVNGWAPLLWALRVCNERLGPMSRLVLIFVAKYADTNGNCFPSQTKLALDTGLTVRSVRRILGELEASGYLSIERGDGRGRSSEYRLLFDAPPAKVNGQERRTLCPPLAPKRRTLVHVKADSVSPQLTIGLSNRENTPNGVAQSAPNVGREGARSQVFSRGLGIVATLTGKPPSKVRSFVGKLLAWLDDDCARLMAVLIEAQETNPPDPTAWLVKHCQPPPRPKRQSLADIRRQKWGLGSFGRDPDEGNDPQQGRSLH